MQTVEERSEESFVHSAPTPLYVLGIAVDVYLDGEATDGQYASYRVTLPARSGPPPHRHEGFDEAFVVLSGTVEVMLEGRTRTLGAGDSVFMPRGAPHAFRNVGGEDAVLMGTATPSGHEHFFRDAGWKEEAGTPEAIRAIFARHGIEIVL